MRAGSLHIAALPFPTAQGTQAALRAMLDALLEEGQEARLLCYGGGVNEGARAADLQSDAPALPLWRIADFPRLPHFRSGPSWRKLLLDLRLALALRSGGRERTVFAHHVEAALAAWMAGVPDFVFVAHTDLEEELESYFPAQLAPLMRHAGHALDTFVCSLSPKLAAVSPWLCRRWSECTGRPVHYLPIPWSLPPDAASAEREKVAPTRRAGEPSWTLLYVGNLDAYQGVDLLLPIVAELRREGHDVHLHIATASEGTRLLHEAEAAGLRPFLRVSKLDGSESQRARLYAEADLVLVPRRSWGGLPVKLLDALARGKAVVASPAACAGLPLGGEILSLAETHSPQGLARAVIELLEHPDRRREMALSGPAYIHTHHSPERFVAALQKAAAQPASIASRARTRRGREQR